jgi:hypothetical protein
MGKKPTQTNIEMSEFLVKAGGEDGQKKKQKRFFTNSGGRMCDRLLFVD